MINLKSISKCYYVGSETQTILKNINLTIDEGEFISIMGPSGSGKSTLMNIIGCLDKPSSGIYLLQGKDISSYNENEMAEVRNSHIGFVFQNFHLLPRFKCNRKCEFTSHLQRSLIKRKKSACH